MIKRLRLPGYLAAFLLPASVVAGYYLGGWYNYLCVLLVFIIIPVLDQLNGTDDRIMATDEESRRREARSYTYVLYSWTLVQIVFLGWTFIVFPTLVEPEFIIGFVLGTGLVTGGIGITVAHELGHKKSEFQRSLSKMLLMTVGYMHFYIEHNKGHHVHVGTELDPATARKNENFYRFWIKTVFAGYFHAWKLEKDRLGKKDRGILHPSNQLIWYAIWPWVYCFANMAIVWQVTGTWSWWLLAFFAAQAFIAFTLLELVNYVEHYGLRRKLLDTGRYEPVTEFHSWNSSHVISNYFLFQLQLHSDHHMYAIKKYQTLQHCENSPQLPAGYPTMILMALLPPLWYRVVHPVLSKWETDQATA